MTSRVQLQFSQGMQLRSGSLYRHSFQKIEEVAKPIFTCEKCGRTFGKEENLERHFWCMKPEEAKRLAAPWKKEAPVILKKSPSSLDSPPSLSEEAEPDRPIFHSRCPIL